METISVNSIVIHDQSPKQLAIWLFMLCLMFILYFIVTTIHDMNREKKLDELKKKIEKEKEEKGLEKI